MEKAPKTDKSHSEQLFEYAKSRATNPGYVNSEFEKEMKGLRNNFAGFLKGEPKFLPRYKKYTRKSNPSSKGGKRTKKVGGKRKRNTKRKRY